MEITYDELLAKIDDFIVFRGALKNDFVYALRAVVELLKEYSDGQVRVNEEFNQGILTLSNVIKEAIEKELE